ncbi:DUF3892 domain-containing protein [Castellaniella ginsengisoli]|uniref:DUF3892 domain-containing protein n=1 Tax=Castellaniella ginsengisoli TaxID=546114 RepID=A0AB39FL37_9BURK
MRRQVTCINKLDRHDPTERITHIGGLGWRIPAQQAIQDLLSPFGNRYFVMRTLLTGEVDVIVKYRLGVPYLNTEADGESQNNLLSLPECTSTGAAGGLYL